MIFFALMLAFGLSPFVMAAASDWRDSRRSKRRIREQAARHGAHIVATVDEELRSPPGPEKKSTKQIIMQAIMAADKKCLGYASPPWLTPKTNAKKRSEP